MRLRKKQHRPQFTESQERQLGVLANALDTCSEFGVETESRERLLMRLGRVYGEMQLLRDMVAGGVR